MYYGLATGLSPGVTFPACGKVWDSGGPVIDTISYQAMGMDPGNNNMPPLIHKEFADKFTEQNTHN